jgi:phosphatidylserine/phosphatidylglycerophosphate/cardiolipin synthase-like enzyme
MQKISYLFSILLITLLLIKPISISADTKNKFYLLPQDNKIALNALYKHIDLAKSSIKISIYTFTHKKIAKHLKKAASRGVKIEIIFDNKQIKSKKAKSMIYYLSKYKNIQSYKLKGLRSKNKKYYGIMHIKMALIDEKITIFGSANWTKTAFTKNYETLMIAKDYALAKKFSKFFDTQKAKAKLFR